MPLPLYPRENTFRHILAYTLGYAFLLLFPAFSQFQFVSPRLNFVTSLCSLGKQHLINVELILRTLN